MGPKSHPSIFSGFPGPNTHSSIFLNFSPAWPGAPSLCGGIWNWPRMTPVQTVFIGSQHLLHLLWEKHHFMSNSSHTYCVRWPNTQNPFPIQNQSHDTVLLCLKPHLLAFRPSRDIHLFYTHIGRNSSTNLFYLYYSVRLRVLFLLDVYTYTSEILIFIHDQVVLYLIFTRFIYQLF